MGACCDSEQPANIEKEIVLSKTPETSKPQTDDNKIYGNTEPGTTEEPQKEPPKKEETTSTKNAKNCPGNHGLTQFSTPSSGYRCDGCRSSIPSATPMYGCRTCDYDLCAECYTGTKTAPPASTKTAVPPTKIPEPQPGANNVEEKEAPPIAIAEEKEAPPVEIAEKKEAVMHSVPVAQIQEITEIDVVGLDKSGVKNISDAFKDDTAYLDLRKSKSSQFQFVLDFGKGAQITSMEIKYHGRYSSTEITIYSSFTDDIDADWTQIGDLKLNVQPERDAAVTINNFIDYKNKRYIKVLFGGEFYSESYINVDRFHFYGIAGVLRTDITDKIAVIDVSGVRDNDSEKYGVARMFNDSNEYFETPKDDNHWLIFDLRGYIVSKIDIEFYSSSYASDSVEFYHAMDLKNEFERIKEYDWEFKTELNRKKEKEPLPKQSITFDMNEAGTLLKHSRLLKMKLIYSEASYAEITFFRIYGELGDAEHGEEKEVEFKYPWQEMEDEDVNEFEEDEDATDVTQSHLIKILETYPKTEDKHRDGFKHMYRPEPHGYWESERIRNKKKDIWLKFDMGPIKIDSFDFSLVENYHAGTVKVYTSKINSAKDSDWSIIKIKRNIPKKETTKFYLKSDHARFIKLAVADRSEDRIEVNRLKWSGFEPVVEDEITNKIKIYQCSGKTDECQSVLKNNQDSWKSAACDPAWIIFDCHRYELDRISITFAEKSKPENVKLRMSDVAPAYSFNIPSIMKWKLNTCQTNGDDEWRNIELVEELALAGNEYDKSGGFQRFIHLEFSTFQINEMQINKIQFFGKLSGNIAEDDEQFDSVLDADVDDEKKQDDAAPYKPEFVDSSASMQGYTTANIWKKEDHFFWMAQYGIPPFLILDLGNNQRFVDEIFIKAYQYYPYKTLKLSTSNKAKAKEWDLLFEDNEMESKMNDGATYDLRQYDVQQYVKMEFTELKMQMFAMASVRIYGDSDFLDKKEKIITWDDIKNMKHIDEDLIHEFREQEQKIVTTKMMALMAQIQALEKDENTGKLSEEWMKVKLEYYLNQTKFYYMFTEVYAYQSATVYEQEQMMKVMVMQKEIAMEEVKKILDYEVEYATKDKLKEEEETKAKEAGNQRQHQQLKKERAEASTVYYTAFSKFFTNLSEKCYAMYSSEKDAKVYECWKEAVENHPRQISSLYNVQEYQAMQSYARKKDPDGFKKCWAVLADLFDESFEQEKELLHKFFVFQLSANYWEARSQSYGRPPVSILFDCASPIVGDDFSRKIHRLEFKIPKPCNINKIVVSTAANIREEKLDAADADDDEKQIDWNNFNIIGQFQLSDELKTEKKENGLGYDDAKVLLDCKNERYVRVEFTEWDEGQTDLEIERIRFFMKDHSDLKDEDEKDGGLQIAKYKLKLIDHNKTDDVDADHRGIADAYKLDGSSYYTTESDIKKPYLIFDCETRKIDQMEIRFDNTSWRQFDVINISTTDNYQLRDSDDAVESKQDEDDWESIFEEEGQFKSYSDRTDFKTVQIHSKNKRYLKLSFVLEAESTNLEIKHLKFHTIDPPNYRWDIDQNIKNLTSQIKIIESTKSYSSQIAENVLADNSRKYRAAAYGVNHKESIEDRIRDKVCYGVNLLRKSRGGQISSHDKHFLKFLLCFQNDRNYDEMLYSSKLVMNILRKPLDIEYKRLQSINSNILTLHVEEKDECKDISSMHSLLEWDYNKWYGPRKAMFWPNDLKPLAEEWTKLGLRLTDPEFTQIRRKGMLETDRSFCSAEDLAMEYVNLIAYKLDPSFQKSMRNLFRQNREKLNLKFPTENADIGVQSGPVKTKARQKIKIILKYFTKKPPQCMSVLDIVRCAIVCDDDVELCSLFELIMNTFSGQILRVKNAFDDVKKGDDSHGYRAVMINIAFGDENVLPKGFRFVCEAQLLLNKYYQVRKNMHLGYGICRSEDGGISQNKKPHYVLAQDSCKFGKLDI